MESPGKPSLSVIFCGPAEAGARAGLHLRRRRALVDVERGRNEKINQSFCFFFWENTISGIRRSRLQHSVIAQTAN